MILGLLSDMVLRLKVKGANKPVTSACSIFASIGPPHKRHHIPTLGFRAADGGAGTRADFSLYVDQELKFQKLKMSKQETATLEVAVPAEAKTLTLIATDGGDGTGHDLLFIGDAKLSPVRPEPRQSDADQRRLAALRDEAAGIERAIAEIPAADKVDAVIAETPAEVRVLIRGNPEEPQQVVAPGAPGCVNHVEFDFSDEANTSGSSVEGERRRKSCVPVGRSNRCTRRSCQAARISRVPRW